MNVHFVSCMSATMWPGWLTLVSICVAFQLARQSIVICVACLCAITASVQLTLWWTRRSGPSRTYVPASTSGRSNYKQRGTPPECPVNCKWRRVAVRLVEQEDTCAVCLEGFSDITVITHCTHCTCAVHTKCVKAWAAEKNGQNKVSCIQCGRTNTQLTLWQLKDIARRLQS
jgi:hypothetical protein